MAKLPKSEYEPLLKEALVCWKCDETFKTIPKLKEHLKAEWEKDAARAKAKENRKQKRKREEDKSPDGASSSKRSNTFKEDTPDS